MLHVNSQKQLWKFEQNSSTFEFVWRKSIKHIGNYGPPYSPPLRHLWIALHWRWRFTLYVPPSCTDLAWRRCAGCRRNERFFRVTPKHKKQRSHSLHITIGRNATSNRWKKTPQTWHYSPIRPAYSTYQFQPHSLHNDSAPSCTSGVPEHRPIDLIGCGSRWKFGLKNKVMVSVGKR